MIRELRRQLENRGFLEVETPTLWPEVGGAAARPFETKAHALDLAMRMRISPELFLKVRVGRADGTRASGEADAAACVLVRMHTLGSGWWWAALTAFLMSASSSATKVRSVAKRNDTRTRA